jgi:nucleoside-diphosphate-sugar epimerase
VAETRVTAGPVFITGGTGLVGRHVIAALTARGTAVRALARSPGATAELAALGAEPVSGDLTDDSSLSRGMAGATAVVHAAAVVLSRRPWSHFHATNVAPTAAIARAAAAAGAQLIHLSSVAVYGRRTTYDRGAASVTEDFGLAAPLFPGDHYARSKREAELAVWEVAASTGLRAVALRPCVVYGEGDRAFAIRVARILRRFGRVAPLIGGGGNLLGVVYAGNVAAAVLGALDRPHVTGPFNVANDGTLTTREFLELFAEGLGVPFHPIPVPRAMVWGAASLVDAATRRLRPGAPMTLLKTAVQFLANPNPYVSARAERELGWRPVVDPRDAVLRTARWFRERGS